jgi:prepilin-type N-terminal cleavage/methylation domain-containing protein
MRNPRKRGEQSGFSLIEVICAILILGIALVGLTQGVTIALASSKESELQTTAALLAAGVIETLQAEGELANGVVEGDGDAGLSLYHWKRMVTATSTDGLHEVVVEVTNARSGKSIYELRTLLFLPPEDTTPTRSGKARPGSQRRRG